LKPPFQRNGQGHNRNGRQFVTNWSIPGETVRIIKGADSQICDKKKAIEAARAQRADLIEIARPENGPSVCRITEVGKLRYELEKSHKKEKQQKTKELGLHVTIGEHDLQTKLKHAREFLAEGDRVVFRLQFRGRERTHKEIGQALLERISNELGTQAKFDPVNSSGPNMFLRGTPRKHEAGPAPQTKLGMPYGSNGTNGTNGTNGANETNGTTDPDQRGNEEGDPDQVLSHTPSETPEAEAGKSFPC
jgi:translation initiation factor IF-3